MMSQAEIYNMQDYCTRKNYELDREEVRSGMSLIGMVIFLMGAMLAVMSACLVVYVMLASVAMTGWTFLAIGIAGIISGIIAMVACFLRRP